MHRFRPASRRSAFTLLEVLVSMLVLAFGVLGTVAYSISAIRSNKESMKRADAAALSFQLLDRLVWQIDWSQLGVSGCGLGGTTGVACSVSTTLNGNKYTVKFIICEDLTTVTGGYASPICGIPAANLNGGPFPTSLTCDATKVAANEKEIRLVIHWSDPGGDCNTFSTQRIVLNPHS